MATDPFSFERDIAPATTRFFNEVGADRRLSNEARTRIQGQLLGGIEDIETRRLQLQEERDKGKLRGLQMQEGLTALDDARARRLRIEKQDAQVAEAQNQVRSIIDSGEPEAVKRQRLADAELAYAGVDDATVGRVFNAADRVIPKSAKSTFTPSQIAEFAAKNVPAEIIATGDPMLIGQWAGQLAERKTAMEEKKKQIAENEQERDKLLDVDFDFDDPAPDDADGTPKWLKPVSTQDAELVVETFGTPEEREQFEKFRSAPSDHPRVTLAMRIQKRERQKKLAGGKSSRAAQIITGETPR